MNTSEQHFLKEFEDKLWKAADNMLTPGRYVGAAEREDDGEPFAESNRLEAEIKKNPAGLGYEL